MAVSEQTPYKEYTANGSANSFALEFDCENQDHLIVLVDDVEPVVGTWSLIGGAVVFGTAPINGKKITIQRNTPVLRSTNFQSFNNSFRPDVLNKDLDRIWLRLQEEDVAKFLLNQLVNMNYEDLDEKGQNIRTELIDKLTTQADELDQKIQTTASQLNSQIIQQGVSQQQLQNYYSFLQNQMANLSSNKNWVASLVVDASGKSQQEINTTLNTDANNFLNLKFNEITNSVKKSIGEIFYDLTLDVNWFGSKADHDFSTGTGTVNDTAFQNCISFIGSLGSIRSGGKVAVKVPSGAYQLKNLNISTFAEMGFGLEFVGDGANSTALYFDESYTEKEAITCHMEGVVFRGIALNGSLTTIAVPTGRTKAIYAKNLTNNADIDISFIECSANAWDDFAHIYGRGFVWRGGQIAHVARFFVLHNEVYNNSTPTKPNNIMRHYRIQGTRVDAVGLLMKVEGSNPSQQINNVNITINDFYSLDRLINFEGHTINGLVETGNSQLHSFATSMIRGTHLKNSVITGACLLHRADTSEIPTTDGECIGKLVDLLGDSVGNVISGNVIKNLRENIIHVRGASIGNIISGNTLPECWSRSNTAVERVLCLFDGSVRIGNIVKDNAVTSSVFSGTFKQTNIPLANLGTNIVKDNTSQWAWADAFQEVYLNVYAGGFDITSYIAVNDRICRFIFDGDYIQGVMHITANTTETGAITASLPVAAISDIPTVTSTFGGSGVIANILGFTTAGYVPAPVFVNAATDKFEFYKIKDLTRTALNWSDGSGSRTLFATFRYRYK